MNKKLIVFTLILVLILTLSACRKSEEVEIFEEDIETEAIDDAVEPQVEQQSGEVQEEEQEEQIETLNGTSWTLVAIDDGSRESVESTETYSFTEDSATLDANGEKFTGSYSLEDEKIILNVDGVDATFKISVDGEEMTVTPEGSSTKYFYKK